jgi:tRNA 5-methylaminomethyl-2-thiouridine biosynthesis bifunctional protein
LRFISVEKFPLTLADMQRASQNWSQFSAISNELIAQYQQLKPHCNALNMAASRIQLALWIDDINDVLPNLKITDENWSESYVDAWLLDGFAPAKNADMWSNEMFLHMAGLSKNSTTFATFTSAGKVRRSLQAVGFNVNKHAGFGKKREMLSGIFK